MIKSAGFIEDWMLEREEKGRNEGRTEEARKLATDVLADRFGSLPDEITRRIQVANQTWCESVIRTAWQVARLEDVDLD